MFVSLFICDQICAIRVLFILVMYDFHWIEYYNDIINVKIYTHSLQETIIMWIFHKTIISNNIWKDYKIKERFWIIFLIVMLSNESLFV
jgi:hypothetical protein